MFTISKSYLPIPIIIYLQLILLYIVVDARARRILNAFKNGERKKKKDIVASGI